jgi:predicted DCC family thiol-disulfide oxidoreductase YuxK
MERRLPFNADVVPWQTADLSAFGITQARAQHEMLWVRPDGRISGGAQAFAALLSNCGGPWSLAGALLRIPPVSWLANGTYRVIARNRHHMPGGSPACALRPSGSNYTRSR